MNPVKIVATLGPGTDNRDAVTALRGAGMDIVRLNGSHADLDWHAKSIAMVRETLPEVPILLDLPGRKIRIANLEQELTIVAPERVVLTADNGHPNVGKVSVDYSELHRDVSAGDIVLIDEGRLRLSVVEVSGRDVICCVENGGTLRNAKGVHLPRLRARAEFLSTRDRELISLACLNQVDFIGLSFVETAADVASARDLVGRRSPEIVCKIETQRALDHLRELTEVSDALMIDRGDLSLDAGFERVALLQKRILAEARRVSCPVIVATEMLHSMIDNPMPTKAELSDITNSVLDGAAALMLSGETAVGSFPTEAVALMRRVADVASQGLQDSIKRDIDGGSESVPEVIGDAIALICSRLEVTKIVAITISGYAARMVAAKMPHQPILAVSNDAAAARRFAILRGTKGVYVDVPFSRTNMDHVPRCLEELWRQGELVDEDLILVTAVSYPKSGNRMNLIETHKVSDLRESLAWQL